MSLSSIILLTSASVFFFYTYQYIWFHAIDLFETYHKGANTSVRPTSVHKDSSSFIKLVVQKDDIDNSTVKIAKSISRVVFSITITTTIVIMEFILIQLSNAHGDTPSDIDSFSLFIWKTSVILILISLILAQPLIVTVLLVNKFFKNEVLNKSNIKIFASTVIMIIWLIFVSKFDFFTDFNDGSFFIGLDNWKSVLFHKIAIIGITLIAILNGIGSYSTFYYYLYKDFRNYRLGLGGNDQEATKQRLQSLRRTLGQTDNLISAKEVELNERDSSEVPNLSKRTNIQPKGSFLDLQILQNLSTDKNDELTKEIRSLVKIKNDISYKIMKIEDSLNSGSYMESNSSYFKSQELVKNIVQKAVAIYCTFKIIQVICVRIISFYQSYNNEKRTSVEESDPLVITISKIIQIFITVQNEDFLVNLLSFLVSGGLFIGSFNGVFLTLRHLYKFIPIDLSQLNKSTSSSRYKSVSLIKNLIISELMGIYGLATLLILKSSLTNDFRSTLMGLLSRNTLTSSSSVNLQDIHLIDNWFDKVYLISVVITITGIRLSEVFGNDYDGFENQNLVDKIV